MTKTADPSTDASRDTSPRAPQASPSLARGRLQVGLAGNRQLRWAATDLTEVTETARRRLDLSPVAAAALGRSVASAALLLRLSAKTPTRLILEVRGDGPLRQVYAEADEAGGVLGTVGHPRVQVPNTPEGKLAVGAAVGRGVLGVLRERQGGAYRSQVQLVSGEIGDDVAHYLDQSEQTRSAVLVGVLGRPTGVVGAGGMIVELLPDAGEEVVGALEGNIRGLPGGVSRVMEDGGLAELRDRVLAGLEARVVEERELHYRCRCDRGRYLKHLEMMGAEQRQEFTLDDGAIEAQCHFCGERYRFADGELTSPG